MCRYCSTGAAVCKEKKKKIFFQGHDQEPCVLPACTSAAVSPSDGCTHTPVYENSYCLSGKTLVAVELAEQMLGSDLGVAVRSRQDRWDVAATAKEQKKNAPHRPHTYEKYSDIHRAPLRRTHTALLFSTAHRRLFLGSRPRHAGCTIREGAAARAITTPFHLFSRWYSPAKK